MSLSEQQRKFAEARMNGLSIKDAALFAGCPEKTASQAGSRLQKHPNVLAHIGRLKTIESDANPAAGRDNSSGADAGPIAFYDDPMEMLKHAMNDRLLDAKTRIQAAMALLPYEHKKLGESGKKEDQGEAAKGAVKGRFSPAAPPPTTPQLKLVN
jgi:phage terminase small subunit